MPPERRHTKAEKAFFRARETRRRGSSGHSCSTSVSGLSGADSHPDHKSCLARLATALEPALRSVNVKNGGDTPVLPSLTSLLLRFAYGMGLVTSQLDQGAQVRTQLATACRSADPLREPSPLCAGKGHKLYVCNKWSAINFSLQCFEASRGRISPNSDIGQGRGPLRSNSTYEYSSSPLSML